MRDLRRMLAEQSLEMTQKRERNVDVSQKMMRMSGK
jgi:hypothetical protein